MALCVALGGTGYALTSSGSSQQVIHACVNNKTGAVRIVKSPHACHHPRRDYPGERTVAWNQTGRAGLTGPTGPSDAYTTGRDTYDSSGGATAMLNLPPGSYIATGHCSGHVIDPSGTPLAWELASLALYVGSSPPANYIATSSASVPNQGSNFTFRSSQYQEGAASLSNSGPVTLPNGGQVSETCSSSSGDLAVQYATEITAIRVGNLHTS